MKKEMAYPHPSRLIDRKELQQILGIKSKNTMGRILANKKDPLPRVHLPGAHAKFPLDKVLYWIANHTA